MEKKWVYLIKSMLSLKEPIALQISLATSDYNSIDNLPNDELYALLENYLSCKEFDKNQEELFFDDDELFIL